MKNGIITTALAAAALFLSTSFAFAADPLRTADAKGTVPGAATHTKDSAKDAAKSATDSATGKLVDINTASEAELKAIPGIGDTYASKIIAGRPYANKTQLKSRKVLPDPVYEKVKDLVVAKQPKK